MGLPGTGLLELKSANLGKESGIAFSFRTQNNDGLILLAKSKSVTHFCYDILTSHANTQMKSL